MRTPDRPAAERPARPADPPLVRTEALNLARQAPIDRERVELIKRAIADGSYPIVPAKIADAMIAAGILLRNGR